MEVKTEPAKKENLKEFESLLKEDFKKRDLKEGNIIKATISEIGKKHIFECFFNVACRAVSLPTRATPDMPHYRTPTTKPTLVNLIIVSAQFGCWPGGWRAYASCFSPNVCKQIHTFAVFVIALHVSAKRTKQKSVRLLFSAKRKQNNSYVCYFPPNVCKT